MQLLLLLGGVFQRPSRSPHPCSCSCSCSDADPAHPVRRGGGGDRSLDSERPFRARSGLGPRLRRAWSGLRLGVRPCGGGGGLIRLRRSGGLRLSLLRLLRSRSLSHGEKDSERHWRGGDEELLKDGDPRYRGWLRERERCGGSPERDERSLKGILPRGETRRRAIVSRSTIVSISTSLKLSNFVNSLPAIALC